MTAVTNPAVPGPARRFHGGGARPVRTHGKIGRIGRTLVGLAMIALAGFMLLREPQLRLLEVDAMSWILKHTLADETVIAHYDGHPVVAYQVHDDWLALRVTAQCSITYYVAPLIALGGAFIWFSRVNGARILGVTFAGAAFLVLLNQVRLFGISWAYERWGVEGFGWAHGPGGSTLMLLGLGLTLVAFFLVVARGKSSNKARARAH